MTELMKFDTPWSADRGNGGGQQLRANSGGPRRTTRPVGWVLIAAVVLAMAGWALAGRQSSQAEAAGVTTFYLHGGGPYTMDGTPPRGTLQKFVMTASGATRTWATTTTTTAAQTIPLTDSFTFHYWSGPGGTVLTTLTFGYSPVSSCASAVTPIAVSTTMAAIAAGSLGNSTLSFSPTSDVFVPAGVHFCWKIRVNFITGGGTTLYSDAQAAPTNFTSTDMILSP
jgi:hypothetical protein